MKIKLQEREHDSYNDYPMTIQETYERLVKSSRDVEFKSNLHKEFEKGN